MTAKPDRETIERLMDETKERHQAIAEKIGKNSQLRSAFSRPRRNKDDARFVERPMKVTLGA
jgi:hypothetical protein